MIISVASFEGGLPGELPDEPLLVDDTEVRTLTVGVQSHLARLDRALADGVPEFSRSYLQQLIVNGAVRLNGRVAPKASSRVAAGDSLTVEMKPTPQSTAFRPEAMDIDVVYEDDHLLVLNKPAGLVVHPAPGNWSGTLLNGLLGRDQGAMLLPRAGIVHRLDKDTSGLMVVARTRHVMDQLVAMIAARSVSREYLALAHGAWQGARTRLIAAPLGRDPRNRLRMAVVDLEKTAGKAAATDITHIFSAAAHCLVKCSLQTGRTHQIRVHMASIGHPLVSDDVYGGASDGGLLRQALHAYRLAFDHPISGRALEFRSAWPPDIERAAANLGLIYS